ncbi:hypothetical protein [Propionivibrio sp.]|uniref:hypothetical protein n=1 Tax=Propionivibrio sp. TaxID=2212460 RepID=UPI003BF33BB6
MLSVLAFKRSLSAGILDGGTGEISFGGSRLNRFMKDVENVTGHMGEGETVVPAEEMANVTAPEATPRDMGVSEEKVGSVERATAPPATEAADPWSALLQVGAQFVSALATAGDGSTPAHPWIERDPVTGARSLKVPLPPPETAGRIADTLSLLSDLLRRSSAGK